LIFSHGGIITMEEAMSYTLTLPVSTIIVGIDKIPVKVCIRHTNWKAFCFEILDFAKKNDGQVYQPLTHPDLQSIPSHHGDERFEMIRDHFPKDGGALLDIGSNWGYFCHQFENLGFDCYAVESDLGNIYFLEKLKLAENRRFRIIKKSIFDYYDKEQFDVVLALNIFHHFLKREDVYQALVNFLQRMDMSMMIFQPHHTSEPQMAGAYRNYEPDEFVQFILRNSSLNHFKPIGEANDGRRIYMIWK